jgi:hypothetical protein
MGTHDMGAMRHQRARRLHAETGGNARQQHALARKIDTFEDFVGGGFRAE